MLRRLTNRNERKKIENGLTRSALQVLLIPLATETRKKKKEIERVGKIVCLATSSKRSQRNRRKTILKLYRNKISLNRIHVEKWVNRRHLLTMFRCKIADLDCRKSMSDVARRFKLEKCTIRASKCRNRITNVLRKW